MTISPLLKIEKLSKFFYMHEQQKEVPSARDVSFNVYGGRLTAIVGPTGSGKSSILKTVYRTYLPGKGRILYRTAAGKTVDLAAADDHTILALRNQELGFVTQFLFALPRQPAIDVVASPLYKLGMSKAEGRKKAGALLKRLHIPDHLWSLSPTTFSGGERQRINLARGIIGRPRLLLLDEPTASLDPETIEDVLQLIDALKQEGAGIVAVFHDPDLVQRMADAVFELDRP